MKVTKEMFKYQEYYNVTILILGYISFFQQNPTLYKKPKPDDLAFVLVLNNDLSLGVLSYNHVNYSELPDTIDEYFSKGVEVLSRLKYENTMPNL